MKEMTKERLEEMRRSPFAQFLAREMGLNLDEAIDNELKEMAEKEAAEAKAKSESKREFTFDGPFSLKGIVDNILKDMEKEGTVKCVEKDGKRFYYPADLEDALKGARKESESKPKEEPKPEPKKEYSKPEAKEQPFAMSPEQLEKFVEEYRAIVEAEKKIAYLFGVEFRDGGAGFGFPSKVNNIIWNLMRIIFGDENAEDIADFVFGNSNFDDVKSLYDELV